MLAWDWTAMSIRLEKLRSQAEYSWNFWTRRSLLLSWESYLAFKDCTSSVTPSLLLAHFRNVAFLFGSLAKEDRALSIACAAKISNLLSEGPHQAG